MLIFHIASAQEWRSARRAGSYRVSTRGRSLAEAGFIHCARKEQLPQVHRQFYAGSGDKLVALVIDTDRLDVEWRNEQVGTEEYPHVYGPINADAVLDAVPLNPDGSPETEMQLFLRSFVWRVGGFVLVMVLGAVGVVVGAAVGGATSLLVGLCLGLLVGIGLAVLTARMLAR